MAKQHSVQDMENVSVLLLIHKLRATIISVSLVRMARYRLVRQVMVIASVEIRKMIIMLVILAGVLLAPKDK